MTCQQICRFGCLLLIIVFTGSVEGWKCPLGFVRYRRSCYFFSHQRLSYWDAISACHHLNSHLAKITSKYENNFIKSFARRHGRAPNYWLGGSDLRIEGTWIWENPVQKMGYSNWYPEQPNNDRGEHCLEIRRSYWNYRWNDNRCHVPSNYICEKSKR